MSNKELEAKVADLEKRIIFLYKSMEKQVALNDQLVEQCKWQQEKISQCVEAIEMNSLTIGMLSEIIKKREA